MIKNKNFPDRHPDPYNDEILKSNKDLLRKLGAVTLGSIAMTAGAVGFGKYSDAANPRMEKHVQTIKVRGSHGPDDIGYKTITTETRK